MLVCGKDVLRSDIGLPSACLCQDRCRHDLQQQCFGNAPAPKAGSMVHFPEYCQLPAYDDEHGAFQATQTSNCRVCQPHKCRTNQSQLHKQPCIPHQAHARATLHTHACTKNQFWPQRPASCAQGAPQDGFPGYIVKWHTLDACLASCNPEHRVLKMYRKRQRHRACLSPQQSIDGTLANCGNPQCLQWQAALLTATQPLTSYIACQRWSMDSNKRLMSESVGQRESWKVRTECVSLYLCVEPLQLCLDRYWALVNSACQTMHEPAIKYIAAFSMHNCATHAEPHASARNHLARLCDLEVPRLLLPCLATLCQPHGPPGTPGSQAPSLEGACRTALMPPNSQIHALFIPLRLPGGAPSPACPPRVPGLKPDPALRPMGPVGSLLGPMTSLVDPGERWAPGEARELPGDRALPPAPGLMNSDSSSSSAPGSPPMLVTLSSGTGGCTLRLPERVALERC